MSNIDEGSVSAENSMRLNAEPRLAAIRPFKPIDMDSLGRRAEEAKEMAYSVTGCNVENASYPVGVCAEQVALSKAVSEGHRKFVALAVSTDIHSPVSPCGACRQFINEFCDKDMPIMMLGKDGIAGVWVVKTLGELLPESFGPTDLLGSQSTSGVQS
ncbi:MAG: hypothetical protein LQ340_006724 [Diploschistes diacapsis]|nr:MAG: hypothetical protein LQ340_006724 [Diploschistes diacapsis]